MRSRPALEQRVADFLHAHGVPPPPPAAHAMEPFEAFGPHTALLVAAVSGGADSLALLVALVRLRNAFRLSLHAAHLDHGLRPESRAEAAYVRRVCHRLGVPVAIGRVDVAALQAQEKVSLEDAARRARYSFLTSVAQEHGATMVLTGHTADDQAETVLMHILRGTGLNGLRGMQPVTHLSLDRKREIIVGRPLLEATRAETEAYCRAARLRPRQDPSNQDRRFLRNRIRLDALPALEAAQPGVRGALLSLAVIAGEAQNYVETVVDALWPDVARREGRAMVLDTGVLLKTHPALRTEIFRRAARALVGEPAPLERAHVVQMDGLLATTGEKQIDLPQGLRFTVNTQETILSVGEPPHPLPDVVEGPLIVPGRTQLGGWTFVTAECEAGVRVEARLERQDAAGALHHPPLPYQLSATIPRDRAQGGLAVRCRRSGDRVRLSGGTRKVQDILTDSKTPRSWRDRVPLVYSAATGELLWVVGAQRQPFPPHNARTDKERDDYG